ncbi:MAG: hypothetical protein ACOYN0_04460 [Phycisphaerales bacterium]
MSRGKRNAHDKLGEQHRRTRAVANECLDMLCRGEAVEARRLARMSAPECPGLTEEIRSLREAASRLSIAPQSPDMSEAVLGRLEAVQMFLPTRQRRAVSRSRVLVAVGLVFIASLAALRQRFDPRLPAPAPINSIATALPADAAATREALNDAMNALEGSVAGSISGLLSQGDGHFYALNQVDPARRALALGDTSRYETRDIPEFTISARIDPGSGALALLSFPPAHVPLPPPGSPEFRRKQWTLGLLTPGPTTTTILRGPPMFPLADVCPKTDLPPNDRHPTEQDDHQ